MNNCLVYKIKDSVDLFLTDSTLLTIYYMNTRQRRNFKVSTLTVSLIEQIDGEHTLAEIVENMNELYDVDYESILAVVASLEDMRIITKTNYRIDVINPDDNIRFNRQINYFEEFYKNAMEGSIAQKKLFEATVLLFGCGSVGGDIALLLAMSGIRSFVLYDFDDVEISDISRHMFYKNCTVKMKKTKALSQALQRIDSSISVKIIDEFMNPSSEIANLIINADFIINTLDVPYIGYTASKISRICMKYKKPHYIAGGFDAHLASTGELVIPYVTPCVECYAKHFKTSLKNWKPKPHPVVDRSDEIGGLASMALFSASFAAIEIIKYLAGIINIEKCFKIRGEFLFDSMSLMYLNVEKDKSCIICGGINET